MSIILSLMKYRLRPFLLALIAASAVIGFGTSYVIAQGNSEPSSEPTMDKPASVSHSHVLASAEARLAAAIARYQVIAAAGGWPHVPPGPSIKPGYHDNRVPLIRVALHTMGDYTGELSDSTLYDADVQQAVARFQERHGQEPDGALGKRTLEQMNVPVELRIAQMQASLEQMQAMAEPQDERYVLVNVAGYYLEAVQDGTPVLISRVIVGDRKNPTPLFTNAITDVQFNPSWHVPKRIAAEEIAAKMRRDPDYLVRAGFTVTDSSGGSVDPSTIDWSQVSKKHFPYRIRQRPGEENALGKIKFNIPDDYDVYLHSTSTPKLFAKADRALSHGCVRVQQARALAYFLMQGMAGWDRTRIDQAYDGSASRVVRLENPVPVYLVYWPSWVDDANTVHFHPDIYDRMKSRSAELQDQQVAPGTSLTAVRYLDASLRRN